MEGHFLFSSLILDYNKKRGWCSPKTTTHHNNTNRIIIIIIVDAKLLVLTSDQEGKHLDTPIRVVPGTGIHVSQSNFIPLYRLWEYLLINPTLITERGKLHDQMQKQKCTCS